MTAITAMRPGDYVKVAGDRYYEIGRIYGVGQDGHLAKPSEGFFGVITPGGKTIDGWSALSYVHRADLPSDAEVVN